MSDWLLLDREDIPAHQRCNQHSHRVRQSLLRDQLSCRAGSLGVGGSAFQLFSLSAFQLFSFSNPPLPHLTWCQQYSKLAP